VANKPMQVDTTRNDPIQIDPIRSEQTQIIEITLPAKQSFRFQCLLEAEEGLAVPRCFDPEHKKQQLWTSPGQKEELLLWLDSLPKSLQIQVLDEWIWDEKREAD